MAKKSEAKAAAKKAADKAAAKEAAKKFDLAARVDDKINEIFGHKNYARAKLRIFSKSQLESLVELAQDRIEELAKEELEAAKQQIAKDNAILEAQRILAAAGIGLDEKALIDNATANAKPTVKVKGKNKDGSSRKRNPDDKFSITDVNGYIRYWCGQGHTPVQFKQAYDKGIRKDELLGGHHRKIDWAFESLVKCEPPKQEEPEDNVTFIGSAAKA